MQTAEQALKALRPKLDGLDAGKLQPFRAPVAQVVANILRVDRAWREDRSRITAVFQAEALRPEHYDDLPQRAQALWHADLQLRRLLDPQGISAVLLAQAEPVRHKLLRAAVYLWRDDPEIGPQVEEIRAGNGYLDLADDLVALAGIFGAHWGAAQGRCEVTEAEVGEARRLASELMTALVGRETSREAAGREIAQVRELRDRAAAYARAGVDDLRAAAAFVYRFQSEAWAERYPSFFKGIGGRRRQAAQPASEAERPAGSAAGNASGAGASPRVPTT